MVPQPRRSVRKHQTSRASYTSKTKFVRHELGNPKEMVLDDAVWSRGLPDDIFCTILACLPWSSFCQLRCVCRKWSLMDQDLIFINAYTRVSSQKPCLFLAGGDRTSWIYEHNLNSWKCVPHSFFCPKGLEGTWSPVGALGSRLLLTNNSKCLYDRDYSFKVYNPLSGTLQTIPPLLAVDQRHIGRYNFLNITCDIRVFGIPSKYPEENCYQILVMDKRSSMSDDLDEYDEGNDPHFSTLYAQVYDSRVSKWDPRVLTALNDIPVPVHNVALFCDVLHYLFIIRCPLRDYQIMRDLMVSKDTGFSAYHVRDGTAFPWLDLPKGDFEIRIVTAHIFVARGRLLLAAVVPLQTTPNTFGKWKSIIIWELLEVGKKWVRTSEIDLREFDPHPSQVTLDNSFFLADGDSLYFGSNGKFLCINVPKRTWCLLPPCPSFLRVARSRTFVYQPGLDLVA